MVGLSRFVQHSSYATNEVYVSDAHGRTGARVLCHKPLEMYGRDFLHEAFDWVLQGGYTKQA